MVSSVLRSIYFKLILDKIFQTILSKYMHAYDLICKIMVCIIICPAVFTQQFDLEFFFFFILMKNIYEHHCNCHGIGLTSHCFDLLLLIGLIIIDAIFLYFRCCRQSAMNTYSYRSPNYFSKLTWCVSCTVWSIAQNCLYKNTLFKIRGKRSCWRRVSESEARAISSFIGTIMRGHTV